MSVNHLIDNLLAGSCCCGCGDMKAENVRLRDLVQTLIENDANEPIADNGMTVLDGWRVRARAVLSPSHQENTESAVLGSRKGEG